jgi:hypothetical protein
MTLVAYSIPFGVAGTLLAVIGNLSVHCAIGLVCVGALIVLFADKWLRRD